MNGQFFRGTNVLITGGLGFIGSTLARRLTTLDARVTLIDSLVPEYGGNLFNISGLEDRLRLNISDVRDIHSIRHLVQSQHVLFNLAGQTSHVDSMDDPSTDLEINCHAQLAILEACRKYNPSVRIVFASTRQVYGKPVCLPVNESHPLRPVDVNGIHKIAGESYHILYDSVFGVRSCVLRLTNTYGPRMRVKDARQTFLGTWIRCLMQGVPFEVWGGEQLRDFTYVDDAVEALLIAASASAACGKVFNLGGDPAIRLRDLADLLIRLYGAGKYIVREFPVERKKIDIGDFYGDYSSIRSSLGWCPKIALEEGLNRTLAFYREHLGRYV